MGLPRGIPVACGGVDNSCMALGARNIAEGRIYASLGSSMWIAVSSRQPLLDDAAKPYVFTHVDPGHVHLGRGDLLRRHVAPLGARPALCANLVAQARAEGRDPYDLMTALAEQSPVGRQASCCSIPAWPAARRWSRAPTSAAPSWGWTWATPRPT